MVHYQVIGIILCWFTNHAIIYLTRPVYYCSGHPSNIISSGAIKFYAGFQKVTSEALEHCDFLDPKGCSWRSPYWTQKILEYIQIEFVKVNSHQSKYNVVPKICGLYKISSYLSVNNLVTSRLQYCGTWQRKYSLSSF